jgi:hypothetical protein
LEERREDFMNRIILLCLGALIVATTALAEDFWVKKEYMQWSDEEVKKILTDSPWAKDITVSAPMAALGRGGPRASVSDSDDAENSGGGGRRGRGGRGGGGGFGADGGGAGREALLTLTISWRSAQPLRKAIVRSRLGTGAAVPPEAEQLIRNDEQNYVIVVTGVPAGMAGTLQNPALLDKSTIRAGKKSPVAARGMDVQPHTQSVDLIYVFPKTQPIVTDDREVEVVLKLGQIEAKKKFNLKEMVYNGKLEL